MLFLAICIDILKDAWSPAITLKTALLSIQSLLNDPVPEDPQDAIVASQFLNQRSAFDATARQWTRIHASSGGDKRLSVNDDDDEEEESDAMRRMIEMGFAKELIKKALVHTNGNENRAVEAIVLGEVWI